MDLPELGSAPIEEKTPTGSDVRYEPEFEELQAEIDKLSSVTAQGGPDWKKVVNLSSIILEKKSKDLLVASYLTTGLFHVQQLEGLTLGLKVYADMLETFWENLFPPKKRMRGRRAAIDWLVERTEEALSLFEGKTIEAPKVDELKNHVGRIEAFLRENLDEAPSFASIVRFLEQHRAKPQATEPSEPGEAKRPPAEAALVAEELASIEDAKKLLKFAAQKIRQAANFLGEQDLSQPEAYRLRRIAIWSLVEGLPPATDGKTRIPPPPAQITNILTKLLEEQNWEALVQAAEARIGEFIYWMDLHYYASQSLAYMGEKYEKAQEALCRETAYFVYRFPGIEDLEFSDGTPFASEDTKRWLKEIALATGGAVTEEGPAPGAAQDQQVKDLMAEEMKKAKALAKKRKLVEAISLIQERMRMSFSGRERLLWQLGLCQILLNGKKAFLALPHLDQILHQIDTYHLEQWEPELALEALKLAWTAFNTSADPDTKKKAVMALDRIARLDATEAVRLRKK